MASTAKKLKHFNVRRNGVILRADWPKSMEWTAEYYSWLCCHASSYKLTEEAVSDMLGFKWKMLSDQEYKVLKLPWKYVPREWR